MSSWGERTLDDKEVHLAVGVDLADVAAVASSLDRYGDRYRRRLFTQAELADASGPSEASALAARFAAKEATLKALRVDADGLPWRSVEIRREPTGAPTIVLHDDAARLASERGFDHWAVSITHEGPVAAAVVVAAGPDSRITHPTARDDCAPSPHEERVDHG